MSRLGMGVLLLLATAAQAQGETILDNGSAAFSTTGTWPTSTAVTGYYGANFQSHAANGAPPGALVVDNNGAGFSATGTWPGSTSVGGYLGTNYQVHAANGEPPSAIVADNASGTATGTWPASTSVSGYYGTNYQPHAAGTGAETFTWTLNVATAGTYEVYARWTAHPNRASNAKYTVTHAAGSETVTINQQANSASWQLIGTYSFNAGAATVSLSDEANGYVIADAVMLAPPGAAPNTVTWTLEVPASSQYDVYARWTQHPNRATNAPYTVNHAAGSTTVLVNQEQGGNAWFLLGTFGFNAGAASVTLTDQANDYVIADAVMLLPPGAAPNSATWTPNVAQAGQYEVYARWTSHANRASNATYTVTHAGGSTPVTVNQQAGGGAWNLLGTFSLAPGSTHKVTLSDQANGYVIADAIRLVPVAVQAQQKLYFVHVDHLNTARLVTNSSGTPVWRNDNTEPFGDSVPDENPSGLGAFEFPLTLSQYYRDRETGTAYSALRDCYDAALGRFCQSDPIGLDGGLNTYAYVDSSPLDSDDVEGLQKRSGGNPRPNVSSTGQGTWQGQRGAWYRGQFYPQFGGGNSASTVQAPTPIYARLPPAVLLPPSSIVTPNQCTIPSFATNPTAGSQPGRMNWTGVGNNSGALFLQNVKPGPFQFAPLGGPIGGTRIWGPGVNGGTTQIRIYSNGQVNVDLFSGSGAIYNSYNDVHFSPTP